MGVASIYNNIAVILEKIRRPQEAIVLFNKAISIKQEILGSYDISVAASLKNLGRTQEYCGKLPDSMQSMQAALKIESLTLGPTHPETIATTSTISSLASKLPPERKI